MKGFRFAILALCLACSAEDKPPVQDEDLGQHDQDVVDLAPDMPQTFPDRYTFCEWREFTSTGDLETDLIGDWVVFDFDTDLGNHSIMRIEPDGTSLKWPLSRCEMESACFLAGAPDLCETEVWEGTWSVEGTTVNFGEFDWPLTTGTADLTFGGIEGWTLYFRAADCTHECLVEEN